MPTVITQSTYFTLGDVPSDTPGWNVTNIDELMKPAKMRGSEPVVIVEAHGRVVDRLWRDGTTRVLNWCINGNYDREGTPYDDVREGVEANLQYLLDNIYEIPVNDDSTRELILHLPSGDTKSGPVQVHDFDWTAAGPHLLALVEIYIPAGRLELGGS